ncbi:beta-lactamase [Aureimonas ureilytica]|uniref:Beta-lactamase n=1 Tax=Aureimonas ureilytica TaxID=401562 RepID=A0A175RTX0_9HYPH|nr:class A beta-lactamase [Aureimonas ureilytica]KTR06758.1 beta-lactamase [Aureimonas ureilytica]
MSHALTRRRFAALAGAGLALGLTGLTSRPARAEADLDALWAEIESRFSARLGAFVWDMETDRRWARRADERFPLCSTFKLVAAAGLLARVDAGQENLSRRVVIAKSDLVTYSPETEKHVGGEGMTLSSIAEAALTQSDNTAGNVLIDLLGGPEGVTRTARGFGDESFRLDRRETALNEAKPGDPRDTTSPAAMTKTLHALLFGKALKPDSRRQLADWMVANRTGDAKLRAGLPKDWRVGDKTGGGDFGTMNDVAVIWPPAGKPILISLYLTETKASFDERNAAFAEIGRALAMLR